MADTCCCRWIVKIFKNFKKYIITIHWYSCLSCESSIRYDTYIHCNTKIRVPMLLITNKKTKTYNRYQIIMNFYTSSHLVYLVNLQLILVMDVIMVSFVQTIVKYFISLLNVTKNCD